MPVSAKFEADFENFNAAIDGAVAKLRNFKVVVDNSGSKPLGDTERAAKQTGNAFSNLATGLSAADKTLGAFGVHIGPEINALREMGEVAGKTSTQLGAIGTASAVAGAALAGIGIGRLIANYFDLDTKIAKLADSWFNLGVAEQEAGARQDVLDRATKNAGRTITDFGEAVNINRNAVEKAGVAAREHAKAVEEEAKAAERAAEATMKLQQAHVEAVRAMGDKLIGVDDIKLATDYIEYFQRVENVTNLSSEALQTLFDALTKGISKMVEQGNAADDLTNQMEQFRLAVVEAQQSHTVATTTMVSDEERLAKESAELAQAMKDNFVIIGQSAQDAAQKASMSWNDAMAAARAGQGTMSGTLQGVIAAGTPGSQVRYDDYGNPYGHIPGVNMPGKISPPGGGAGTSIFVDARESFYDTAAGAQRLADKVVTALGTRAASQGAR